MLLSLPPDIEKKCESTSSSFSDKSNNFFSVRHESDKTSFEVMVAAQLINDQSQAEFR